MTVSLTSIAAVCGLDREGVAQGVKQILAKFVSERGLLTVTSD